MALLSASNLQKSFGEDAVLSGVSFEVQENDRIGLVGVNGSGKTTLFKLLTGEYSPDGGEIYQAKNCTLGYMEQHVCRDLDRSAYAEVLTVFSSLLQEERELEEIAQALQGAPRDRDALIERQTRLNDHFVAEGGLTCRARARSALLGLGFTDEQMAQPIGVLSGGQKAKLQLAKMLLCGANLLLLDEPTNHLDIPSVEWLEDFLRAYHGAYLVISHDRYFLDRVTSRTFELEHSRLTIYKGNYSAHLALKAENRLAAQRRYDNTQREITRLEGVVAQQRQWNREKNIRTAESKLKVIERLKSTLERPEDDPDSIRFQFHISQRGGDDVLSVKDLALSFEGRTVFHNANLNLRRGERVFLIGANGCGKTSLFKTLLGVYRPDAGSVRFGTGIDVGYYDQLQQGLDPKKTVLDEIWDAYPEMTLTEVRNALAVFLFRGQDVEKPVSALSGGERARVLLLRLMLSKVNFLLLDEPTNHLDIASSEALEEALRHYEGTLLIVSHDRYLINKIADRLYVLTEDGTQEYLGNYDTYLEKRRDLPAAQQAEKPEPRVNEYKKKKERESELRRMRTALRRLEEEIAENESEQAQTQARLQDPEVSGDYQAALDLSQQLEALRAACEERYARWEALSEELERAQEQNEAPPAEKG